MTNKNKKKQKKNKKKQKKQHFLTLSEKHKANGALGIFLDNFLDF